MSLLKSSNTYVIAVIVSVLLVFTYLFLFHKPTGNTVGIQPLGKFSQVYIDSVQSALHVQYGFKVIVLPEKPLPKSCFVQIKSPRYRADKLLKHLKSICPDSIDYLLGITQQDISTSKKDKFGNIKKPVSKYEDWGIFGLGYRPGKACVVSTYRLEKPVKTVERLQKVVTHELGHNLGLKHCTSNLNCVMDDAAETIRTVDKGHITLCRECKRIVSH